MSVQVTHDSSFAAHDFTITTPNNELHLCSDNELCFTAFPDTANKVVAVRTEFLHPQDHTEPSHVTNIMFDNGDVGCIYWNGQEDVYYEIVDLMGDE